MTSARRSSSSRTIRRWPRCPPPIAPGKRRADERPEPGIAEISRSALRTLNLLRKPLSTLLTVFGVGVALLLFCFLEIVLAAFNAGVNMSDASRLVVQHKESIIFELPMAYRSRIEQIEGVTGVSLASWFGAVAGAGSRRQEARGVLRPVRHRYRALPAALPGDQGSSGPASRPARRPDGLFARDEDRRAAAQESGRPPGAAQHDPGPSRTARRFGSSTCGQSTLPTRPPSTRR